MVKVRRVPGSAFPIFDNWRTVGKRLRRDMRWPRSQAEEYGRERRVRKQEQAYLDLDGRVYSKYGHVTEGAVYTVTTWSQEGVVLHREVRKPPLMQHHGSQASLKVALHTNAGEPAREVLWHRLLAFFGPSERVGVHLLTTWAEFDRTFPKLCANGKTIRKHVYEVEHVTKCHQVSFVDAMVIMRAKPHRRLPHSSPEAP